MPVAIQCRGLRKTYEGKVEAVRGLDLEIHTGECCPRRWDPSRPNKTTTIEIAGANAERSRLKCRDRQHRSSFLG